MKGMAYLVEVHDERVRIACAHSHYVGLAGLYLGGPSVQKGDDCHLSHVLILTEQHEWPAALTVLTTSAAAPTHQLLKFSVPA